MVAGEAAAHRPRPRRPRLRRVVYNTMWGRKEFSVTGNLADYDHTDRL